MRRWIVLIAAVAAVDGCGGSANTGTGPTQRTPAAIGLVSGDHQTGTVGQTLAQPLVVRVTDKAGAGISGVSVTWAVTVGGGSLSNPATTSDAQGQAVLVWTLGHTAGSNSVTAAVAGLSGSPVQFAAIGAAGAVSRLVFTRQPTATPAGFPITPSVQITAQDSFGNPATSFTDNVMVAIGNNSSGGTLSGATSVAAVAGVANFTNLSIDSIGTNYTLTAAASGLAGTTSATFDVTPLLAFTVQPSATVIDSPFTPAVQVTAEDIAGNAVAGFTGTVTVAIATNSGGGTLAGTTSVPASSGVATFATLRINHPGQGYTLRASSGSLGVASSDTFSIMLGRLIAVAAGGQHTCGLVVDSTAYCWGLNAFGQIGDGSNTDRTNPTPVGGGYTFRSLDAGSQSSCGVTTNGAAYCWGSNGGGQIGNGTTNNQKSPVPVLGGITFSSVSVGGGHACGLTGAGAASCWGFNYNGEIGDGTTTERNAPVAVHGGLTFAMLTTGGHHTCGVTTGGAAYCWGKNDWGQLGDGDTTDSDVPVAVLGGLAFAGLSAGVYHTCGVTTSGAAYCWGGNDAGQLGNGSSGNGLKTSDPLPVAVLGGLTFGTVAAGLDHTCGVTTSGAAYCWGHGNSGELGDGTTNSETSPVMVVGGLTFTAASTGNSHTCGLTSDGRVYCWGANAQGQLGNGTNANSPVPRRVP